MSDRHVVGHTRLFMSGHGDIYGRRAPPLLQCFLTLSGSPSFFGAHQPTPPRAQFLSEDIWLLLLIYLALLSRSVYSIMLSLLRAPLCTHWLDIYTLVQRRRPSVPGTVAANPLPA
jgi:hypothetical protein